MSEQTTPKTASKTSVPNPTTPAWCQVGCTVAIVSDSHAARSSRSVTIAKVLRIGKRDIVLDNDQRFSVERLSRRVGGTWGHDVTLADPKSDAVRELRESIRRENLIWKAKVAAEDLIKALAPLVRGTDEILAVLP